MRRMITKAGQIKDALMPSIIALKLIGYNIIVTELSQVAIDVLIHNPKKGFREPRGYRFVVSYIDGVFSATGSVASFGIHYGNLDDIVASMNSCMSDLGLFNSNFSLD